MRLVIAFASSSRWIAATALAASVGNGLLVSLTLASLNQALNASTTALPAMGLQFMALVTAMTGLRWVALAHFVRLSQVVLARLRMHVSRHIAALPFDVIEARGEARLLAVLTEDVSTVGEGFVLLPWLLVHVAVIVGCLGYLAWLSMPVFAFLVVSGTIGSFGYVRGARAASSQLRDARRGEDDLFSHFQALLRGAKELRLHAARRSDFLSKTLAPSIEVVRKQRSVGLRAYSLLSNWRLMLFFAAIGAALFLAPPMLGISDQIRSGYALILLYMMLPVNALLEALPVLSRMRVGLERISELGVSHVARTAVPPSLQTRVSATRSEPEIFRSVELRGVVRRYHVDGHAREFKLGPLDLTLRSGEVVFLIGGNGSGKTTLAKLLVGLYAPNEGEIRWNDALIDEHNRHAYRELFSTVFTDFHLFGKLLGESHPDLDERANALLKALELDNKVSISEGVLSTTELSSGQRKRLALLAAVVEDRPVYVFDEWAADQDPAYKDVFYGQVLPELKRRGKAVLVISHDDRYFNVADRCLKLEAGVFVSALRTTVISPGVHAGRSVPSAWSALPAVWGKS